MLVRVMIVMGRRGEFCHRHEVVLFQKSFQTLTIWVKSQAERAL